MALKIWLNDGLVDEADAKISVFDHGLLYGDGVFEGIRVYGTRIFELDAHIARLFKSASAIRLPITQDAQTLKTNIETTVKANQIDDGYLRLIVTRGVGTLGLNPLKCEQCQIIIIADTIELYPKELYENGLRAISAKTIRNHPMSLSPQIKSLNYLNNILAKLEALDHGVLEAIMYNHDGFVAEGTVDNLFIVHDGAIVTPPCDAGSLEGITRAVIMNLAQECGYQVTEQNLTRDDLYKADEIFLTGTATEVIAVVELDKVSIGSGKPGPVTRELLKKFGEYVRS